MYSNEPQDSPGPWSQGPSDGSGHHGHRPGYDISGHGHPAPYGAYGAPAPFGYEPTTGIPYSDKSKIAAGLLQIFFGTLGVGRFYMGSTGIAVAQLILTLLGWATTLLLVGFLLLGAVGLWALVDGIVILAGRPVDGQGRPLRP